tara:strand:+ start:204 stop:560 length:357 start_codon:yes stop_codon:yes gene_type:complete
MLGFGSAKFGEANYGRGVIQSNACIIPETVNIDVFPYVEYQGWVDPKAVVNVDVLGGLIQGAWCQVETDSTIIASGIKMTWAGWCFMGIGTSTVNSSGFIAWDSQLVDEATWSTQTVD